MLITNVNATIEGIVCDMELYKCIHSISVYVHDGRPGLVNHQ